MDLRVRARSRGQAARTVPRRRVHVPVQCGVHPRAARDGGALMPYDDQPGKVASWLHRHGVAARVSSTYSSDQWTACIVNTMLPFRWLANIARRRDTPHLRVRSRVGRWEWCWIFAAEGMYTTARRIP